MRGQREQMIDCFNEAFLTIGKENETVSDWVFWNKMNRSGLQNISKILEKPKPIRVIFGIDNRISKREKRTIAIDSRSGKKNPW